MAIQFYRKLYALSESGALVEIGKHLEEDPTLMAVGGKIFYIDPSSDEVVQFYDQNGQPLSSIAVGDSPYAYKVLDPGVSGKEKYYVYYDALYSALFWAPSGLDINIAVGNYVQTIGAGKPNTTRAFAYKSGAMVVEGTVWYQIKQMRDNLYGGCNDWFLPSPNEIEALRSAITYQVITTSDTPLILPAGPITGGVIAGTADGQAHYFDYGANRTCYPSDTQFVKPTIQMFSSSERNAINAYDWDGRRQTYNSQGKRNADSMFAIRSF